MAKDDKIFENLPNSVVEYINLVIKNMRYRKKARDEVREELIDHFEQHLKDCATNEEKEQKVQQLISEFGDPKLLAILMRRAKKRCRPLWQKILVRSFAAALVIFAYLLICASWLRMGTPTIRINYAQWLTDQQRQGRDESLNAKPEIDKAIEAIHDVNELVNVYDILRSWPTDLNDAQKNFVSNFLRDNNQAFENLKTALQKPYFWTDYNSAGPIVIGSYTNIVENPQFWDNLMQSLASYRRITYALAASVNWRAHTGDFEGAVDDLSTLIKFSSHYNGQTLVEQLVSVAIKSLTNNRIIQFLSHVDLSAAQLKKLQNEFSASFSNEFPFDLTGEKAFWYSHIEQGFTDNGRGNGRILKSGAFYFVRDWRDWIWSFLTFSFPDRKQAVAEVEKTFDEIQQNLQITPWQKKDKLLLNPSGSSRKTFMLKVMTDLDSISIIGWRLKTHQEATLTILAAMRYQKDKAAFPDNLEQLVNTGYLAKLPQDPFGPSLLTYKKTDNAFLLYSWGENLKDDGGQVMPDKKGWRNPFSDNGDWVFWPMVDGRYDQKK